MRQIRQIKWLPVYNAGSYTIPSYGLVEIIGANHNIPDRMYLRVDRPSDDGVMPIAINSFQPIEPEEYGLACIEGPVYVSYGTGTPSIGESWGAGSDSFQAKKGEGGLIVFGAIDTSNSIVLVNFESPGKKQFCRFTLDEALTTSDESVTATITDQYGPGSEHSDVDITVFNLETHDGSYEFYGDSGDAGWGGWDADDNWIILQLECP